MGGPRSNVSSYARSKIYANAKSSLQGFSAIDPLLSTYATWSSNTPEKPNAHVRSTTQPNAGSITNPSFFDDPSTPSRDEDSEISKILTPKANEPLTLEEGAKPVREISNALR